MATISPTSDFVPPTAAPAAVPRVRDPRLDFYRGIAMFIILIAHIPNDPWARWIPARFGFSDATEIFVFCSGMASAIAFGGAYLKRGWWMGTARVSYRIWQVYWAHIALFFFVATSMAALDLSGAFDKSYVSSLNLQHFFNDPMPQMLGLFTLTYVPNYFDILPMYLVVLALMPLFLGLYTVGFWAVALASVSIWAVAQTGVLALPAEPWSQRQWFFNPFGWQLLFFTGFAFMRGWIPAPPVSKTLMWIAALFLVLSAPFGSWKVFLWVDAWNTDVASEVRKVWPLTAELREKTDFGLFRYMHFLALAYLGWVIAGEKGERLVATGTGWLAQIWQVTLTLITKVGQQSLAVFVFSMAAARLIGVALDQSGRTMGTVLVANLIGFAMIIGVAYLAAWFKSQPWKAQK
ncbi:OpgC domain-containing protein [Phaeobacter gallaeciensis]|uniref:OpgC domain-containing protein n=2 Tax=Roseobacteraceae TaxID=2854170 RepID=A0A366WJU7_9RHOB|nr:MULTISPECIES: OpgC domain-containing protein [Roseobacteraceae]MBT3143686.1 OpgC domain-containing protein [Falsiruegeria litorea]MBT8167956.1 OpgC domain-containing protein [Falsiruegeria litorea]RBW49553.1 OpgC domain-containing protein [Phaeobacter gallaeciensis]